ncbi:MAG: OmpA family protein [Rickettsiales bacterium]|nr:OmpA family protein [Rickettsiales bacterium]
MAEKKDDEKRPIIVKKIKKVAGGHHGGAWKVAYADFVTAMMAFFLMLWLISTTSQVTKQALADYFTPTSGIRGAMGIGFEGGQTISEDPGIKKRDSAPPNVVIGATPSGIIPENPEKISYTEAEAESALFEKAQTSAKKELESDPTVQNFRENIFLEQTPEGLKIEIMDSDKYPMFIPGKPELTQAGQAVLSKLVPIIKQLPNYMTITGHTDASPLDNSNANYTNWELSGDRANAARRFFIKSGIEPERPKRVIGMADREPLDKEDPRNPKNRRITIIMLKGSHIALPEAGLGTPGAAAPAPTPPATEAAPPARTGGSSPASRAAGTAITPDEAAFTEGGAKSAPAAATTPSP